jgi:hypothetical protein
MRHSQTGPRRPLAIPGRNAEVFVELARRVDQAQRTPAIVLIGARDPLSIAAREAQGILRYDLKASYWSDAALILDWPEGEDLSRVTGVEVTLRGAPSELAPERNGVRPFRASEYLDDDRFPNLCVAAITNGALPESILRDDWRERVSRAALTPNARRVQYRLYEWIGTWIGTLHKRFESPNAIAAGVPHPGAALLEMAFAAAPIDLAPGGTSPAVAPEHLWATFLHWHDRLAAQAGELVVVHKIGDESARDPAANDDLRSVYSAFRISEAMPS